MKPLPPGLIAVLSGANFVIGMGAFLVIGALTPIGEGLDITDARAGWVLTIYSLAYCVLSPLLVALTGRLGRRKVITTGMALFGVASAWSALAPGETSLWLARALAAAGAGITTPVAAAVAAALAPPEMRATLLAKVFMGLTVAQLVGVPFGSWVAYAVGWRAAFWIVALLAAASAVSLWIKVPRGLSFQPVALRDLGAVLASPRLMLAVLFTASFLSAIYVPFTYIAPLLEETMGLGRNGVTLVLVIAGFGAVIGNLIGGALADRLGPVRTLALLAVSQVMLMPILSHLPLPLWIVFALTLIWFSCGYGFNAGQQSRLVALAGPRAPVALSLHAASIYLGAAIGAAIGGWVISTFGLLALGIAGGMMALLAVVHIMLSARMPPVDTGAPAA